MVVVRVGSFCFQAGLRGHREGATRAVLNIENRRQRGRLCGKSELVAGEGPSLEPKQRARKTAEPDKPEPLWICGGCFTHPKPQKKKQLWAAPPAEALGPEGVPRKRGGFGPAANAPFSTVWRAAPFTIACPHPETRKRHQSMGTNEGGTESAPGMRPPRPRAKPPIFSSKPAPPPSAFIAAPRGKFQKAKSKKKKLHLENRKRSPCTYILGEGGGAQNPPENEPHS